MTENLVILDTTLRDGEQSPGRRAQRRGQAADRASARPPRTSTSSRPVSRTARRTTSRPCEAIAEQVEGPVDRRRSSRCFEDDVRACAGGARSRAARAAHPRLHRHVADPPRGTAAHDAARGATTARCAMTSLARRRSATTSSSRPMDASRTEREYLAEVRRTAASRRAPPRINLPDTVGYATPDEWRALIAWMYEQVPALRRCRALRALPQRPRSRDRELAGQRARRGAPDRDVRQRHRRARRQRRARGGRDGHAAAPRGATASRTQLDHAQLVSHVAARVAAHRDARAAQQVGGRRQRVRAPLRHPPGRHAQGPPDLRDHGARTRRRRLEPRARQASAAGTRFATGSSELGYRLDGEELQRAFVRFKALADRKRDVTDRDLEAIVADERQGGEETLPPRAPAGELRHQPATDGDRAHAAQRWRQPRGGVDRRRAGRRRRTERSTRSSR